ncbi:MAG: PEP/pyruvate-binding domain-containing protein [Acidimicrobiia bacterium]
MTTSTGASAQNGPWVFWFEDPDCGLTEIAGGKGANLAMMAKRGLPVPPGFVVRADALEVALRDWGSESQVRDLLGKIDSDTAAASIAPELQTIVHESPPRGEIADQIRAAYEQFSGAPVAVRSSACAEDAEAASFAGQQETYLNVRGSDQVVARVGDCWGSFFAERALFYRRLKSSLDDLGMAVVVQRLLNPDKAGVLFTTDPIRQRRDQMVVEGAWGLGEGVVSGRVIPDHYIIKRDGRLKRRHVAEQKVEIVLSLDGGTEEVPVDPAKASRPVLSEEELVRLAELGRLLEDVFGTPQDVEWAIEGDEVFLLQSRPITT